MAILVDRFLSSTRQMEAEDAARAERKRRVAVSNTLVSAPPPPGPWTAGFAGKNFATPREGLRA